MTNCYRRRTIHTGHRAGGGLLFCLCAMLFLVSLCGVGHAQTASPYGRQFFIAFPDTVRHLAPKASSELSGPLSRLIFFSLDTATVTVRSPKFSTSFTVYPQSSYVLQVPPIYADESGRLQQNVYQVNATSDISVYCYFATPFGGEMYTALPVSSWGTEYFAMTHARQGLTDIAYTGAEESFRYFNAASQIVIIASQVTQVTVRSTADIGTLRTRRFEMLEGDVMLLSADTSALVPDNGDLSGTIITASRPIGVISGNARMTSAPYVTPPDVDSPLENSAIEWLAPTRAHGTRFAYRPLSPIDHSRANEIIRVYATAPGVTQIRNSASVTQSVPQGSYVQFNSIQFSRPRQEPTFEISTDKPAEAMVISAPYARFTDTTLSVDFSQFLWGAAMSELLPHERWTAYARFHSPEVPVDYEHYISIVADSAADVRLDGREVDFGGQVVAGSSIKHIKIVVGDGDHTIYSANGTFTAIAYGHVLGFEDYRPVKAGRPTRESLGEPLGEPAGRHPSVYLERMALAYAYPVAGVGTYGRDSLVLRRVDDCDSTVAILERPQGAWVLGVTHVEILADSANADIVIDTLRDQGGEAGYRIRFMPRDRAIPARATVVVTGDSGKRWEIPYLYEPAALVAAPNPLDLLNVPIGLPRRETIVLGNTGSGRLRIISARLKNGSAGFSLPGGTTFPDTLDPLGSGAVEVEFIGTVPGSSYADTLVIETPCFTLLVPLAARTRELIPEPSPELTGYDWKERWLTPANECTKGDTIRYRAEVLITNSGEAPFQVLSLDLAGADADAGIFQLGTAPALLPGEQVTSGEARYQEVFFLPRDERAYSCTIRLITTGGDTVVRTLEGVGIESHVRAADTDFGRTLFSAGVGVQGESRVTALPTRPLTVTGLRIAGPGAADFAFDAGFTPPDPALPATWWHLAPGESRAVPLLFTPSGSGERSAELLVLGDHAICDDSTGLLRGATFIIVAGVTGDTLFRCGDSTGFVTVSNVGSEALQVADIILRDGAGGAFRLDLPLLPFTLGAGESRRIPVVLLSDAPGRTGATVLVALRSADGSADLGVMEAALLGINEGISAPASIGRDFVVLPGERVVAPVVLDAQVDDAAITGILFSITYDRTMLLLDNASGGGLAAMLAGTRLQGWSAVVEEARPGSFRARFSAPPGETLRGTGPLLNLEFRTFLGSAVISELPFTLSGSGGRCLMVNPHPGLIRLDSICGLGYRLIELTESGYALDGNHPNPFNPSTVIEFSLGLDARTIVTVHDAAGHQVATLLDEPLMPGRYQVRWDASGHPSGLYYCTVASGMWQRGVWMVLAK